MAVHLCEACGTSFPDSAAPPERCPICEDERQFVPPGGQAWMRRETLGQTHRNAWRQHEAGLLSLHTVPAFAIDQRAFLLRTPAGNILWDCISLLDAATRTLVDAMGGLLAIAISHPHYYTTMADWAEAFQAPVLLHAADRDWITRPAPLSQFWDGDSLDVAPGVTLIRVGGHFAGGTVLHWAAGAGGRGVLLSGDILQVTPGGDRVSFQWSYPNMLPLPAGAVRSIAERLAPWRFDRIYGAFVGREILAGGAAALSRSADRYAALLADR